MARTLGRKSRIEVGATEGAAATVVSDVRTWTFNTERQSIDATCIGDTSTVSLAGLPGGSGSFTAIFNDSGSSQIQAASIDGLPRAVIIYPNYTDAPLQNWDFTATFSISTQASHDGLTEVTGTWQNDTSVTWNDS